MKHCIPEVKLPIISELEYWDSVSEGETLEPLSKPCRDCAVVNGFYREYAERLGQQSKDTVKAVSLRWYCHNRTNRACAGNLQFQKESCIEADELLKERP